jgi:hypothetical protein
VLGCARGVEIVSSTQFSQHAAKNPVQRGFIYVRIAQPQEAFVMFVHAAAYPIVAQINVVY